MKILLLLLFAAAPEYRQALPGYRYQFPRDHFDHPDFRTEWWYYTGNVRIRATATATASSWSSSARDSAQATPPTLPSWRIDDLYLAHLALTDIDGQRFRYYKRLNRAGPGIAGARSAECAHLERQLGGALGSATAPKRSPRWPTTSASRCASRRARRP